MGNSQISRDSHGDMVIHELVNRTNLYYQHRFSLVFKQRFPIVCSDSFKEFIDTLTLGLECDITKNDFSSLKSSQANDVACEIEDMIDIWCWAITLALNHKESRFELLREMSKGKQKSLKSLLLAAKRIAKESGVESCLDAYWAGVPKEDIMA